MFNKVVIEHMTPELKNQFADCHDGGCIAIDCPEGGCTIGHTLNILIKKDASFECDLSKRCKNGEICKNNKCVKIIDL
jgi:hypothetical protein